MYYNLCKFITIGRYVSRIKERIIMLVLNLKCDLSLFILICRMEKRGRTYLHIISYRYVKVPTRKNLQVGTRLPFTKICVRTCVFNNNNILILFKFFNCKLFHFNASNLLPS